MKARKPTVEFQVIMPAPTGIPVIEVFFTEDEALRRARYLDRANAEMFLEGSRSQLYPACIVRRVVRHPKPRKPTALKGMRLAK